MSVDRRKHVGWEVRCDATGCTASSVQWAPWQSRKTRDAAVQAALELSWIEVLVGGQPRWVCPMHQTWDPRLRRWVATPLSVLT